MLCITRVVINRGDCKGRLAKIVEREILSVGISSSGYVKQRLPKSPLSSIHWRSASEMGFGLNFFPSRFSPIYRGVASIVRK